MSQDVNEGIAYLMALKQSGAPSGGAAAAPAREVAATEPSALAAPLAKPEEQFQGAEKRRSNRYRCEGSVEVREDGCEVRTWASFTDISLHGCYVEAQATYPSGTLLHMKLEANEIRIEVRGTVRVTYPYLGMGISFEEISEDNRARLKQLLATLSHRCLVVGPGNAPSATATSQPESAPQVTDPAAAMKAILDFFENRQLLMRDDFVRILKKSQKQE